MCYNQNRKQMHVGPAWRRFPGEIRNVPGRVGRWEDDSGRRKRLEETLHGLHFIKTLQFREEHANWKAVQEQAQEVRAEGHG